MEHRGEIIEQAVRKSGMSLVTISKKMGKSRRWLYLQFENPLVSLDVVLQIGKIIHYDFAQEIKEFNPTRMSLEEPLVGFKNEENSAEYWKNKYLKLLEDYSALLKEKKV